MFDDLCLHMTGKELGCELGTIIADNNSRQSSVRKYTIQLSQCSGSRCIMAHHKCPYVLGISINDY